MEISCPYCVSKKGVQRGDKVYFPPHKIEYAANGPMTEFCPIGNQSFVVTNIFEQCADCDQKVLVLKRENGKTILAGHNYSWGTSASGERIKVAPFGGFFNQPFCNGQVEENSIYVSNQILKGGATTVIPAPALN